jgi:hypothetical protein
MKPSVDLATVKSKSKALRKLGRQFHEVLLRYAEEEEQKDFIWRYSERSLVGALAAAVWLAGGVALEEYGGRKQKGNTGEGHGRTDLYFKLGEGKYVCEAKHDYIALDAFISGKGEGMIGNCLKDAENNTLNGDEIAVGVAFWSVWVERDLLKAPEGLRGKIEEACNCAMRSDRGNLLTTCYFPAWALAANIDHGEGDRHYLGVVMRLMKASK